MLNYDNGCNYDKFKEFKIIFVLGRFSLLMKIISTIYGKYKVKENKKKF